LSRENAGRQIATRTHYLKPLPFILRSIEVNDFRNSEVMDGTMSMQDKAYNIALPGCHRKTS